MELPWIHRRCIVCLRDDIEMTRAHLVPQSLGGFVWARTHCADCNNGLGARVEASVKHDPTIRYAVEHALVDELGELARTFAEGQPYVVPSEQGPLVARYRGGAVELATTKLEDGSLVQDRARAVQTIENMLARAGADAAERQAAVERIAAADVGELMDIGRGLVVRHGTTAGASMTLDGKPVSDEFPLAMAYHLLAFFIGELIYVDALDPARAMLRGERPLDDSEVLVEGLIDRSTGYVPQHVLGLSRVEPHLRIRVQLFGPPIWHVHLLSVKAPKLKPMGIALDVKRRIVHPAVPARSAKS
jgi:fructose-specific component phosphotransferase system IIB-like protein